MIACNRNPLGVSSLVLQALVHSTELSLTLWYRYNDSLLSTLPQDDGSSLIMAPTLSDLKQRYAAYSISSVSLYRTGMISSALSGISPRLRHHRLTARHLRDAGVMPPLLDLYTALCEEAEASDEEYAPDSRILSSVASVNVAVPRSATVNNLSSPDRSTAGNVGGINRTAMDAMTLRDEVQDLKAQATALHEAFEHLRDRSHMLDTQLAALQRTTPTRRLRGADWRSRSRPSRQTTRRDAYAARSGGAAHHPPGGPHATGRLRGALGGADRDPPGGPRAGYAARLEEQLAALQARPHATPSAPPRRTPSRRSSRNSSPPSGRGIGTLSDQLDTVYTEYPTLDSVRARQSKPQARPRGKSVTLEGHAARLKRSTGAAQQQPSGWASLGTEWKAIVEELHVVGRLRRLDGEGAPFPKSTLDANAAGILRCEGVRFCRTRHSFKRYTGVQRIAMPWSLRMASGLPYAGVSTAQCCPCPTGPAAERWERVTGKSS